MLSYSVQVGYVYNDIVLVSARVTSIVNKASYSSIVLDDVKINSQNKPFSISISTANTNISLGNILTFEAKLKQVELFNEQNKFNSYFYKNDIAYMATIKSDILISEGYLKLNEKISNNISQIIQNGTSSNVSEIIKGVIVGDKTYIDGDISSAFFGSGVAHLLAISGLHISVIVGILTFVLQKLKVKNKPSFVIMLVLLLVYCYICNFSPSVVRASIMSLVFLLAYVSAQKYDKLNCLALSAILILLFKPLYIFDAGFLLSFGCVFCIFTLTKPVKTLLYKIKCPKKIVNPLALVVAVQFGILPISCLFFDSFNFLSIVANLICVPLFEVAYIIGFACCIICLIFPFLCALLQVVEFLFFAITNIANFFNIPALSVGLPKVSVLFVIVSYMVIFICSKYINLSKLNKLIYSLPLLAIGLISIVV